MHITYFSVSSAV